MPPSLESEGNWKLLIVTPGRPLNALKDTFLVRETLSKMVPEHL